MTRRSRHAPGPIAIALAVIAIGGAIAFYAFNEGLPFVSHFRVYALLTDANALRPRSPVRIAGMNVGRVVAVGAGPGETTRVTMELASNGLPLHRDATIRVRPRLFVEGGYYVDLSPGSPSAPDLHDGDTIPPGQTRSAVQLYQLLSSFDQSTRTSVKHVLRAFAGALAHGGAQGLRAAAAPLAPALRGVAIASDAARGTQQHDLSTVVSTTARVAGALAAREADLASLVSNLDTTSTALASQDGAIGATVSGLDGVLRASPPALTALDSALGPLTRFSRALDPGLVVAPPLLTRLSSDVAELGALVAPAERRRVVAGLRSALVDLPELLRRLTAVVSVAKPISDCVSSHLVPILTSQIDDGALSTHRPVWQDIAHALPGIASAAQDFDGNGFAQRYQMGTSNQTVSTGALPGIGVLSGSQPGASPVSGSRPVWSGRLQASAFQPGADCASQPLPSLASQTAPSDLAPRGRGR